MTVNKNNRSIFIAAVFLIAFSNTGFCQSKNILRIRFETAKVKPGTQDAFLNVFYKIEGTKPVNFTGFDCRFNYDQTKLRPTNAFFDGTASGRAGFAHGNNDANNTYHVLVSNSPNSLDTSKAVLFQVYYSLKTITDSGAIAPVLFDVGGSTGIDTVIIENAGRDDVSWFPFGIVFLDTTKVVPPKKKPIVFTTDSTNIASDSTKIISLNVSSLDSTSLKNSIFEFNYDTAVFAAVTVTKGSLLTAGSLSISTDTSHIAVQFSNADTTRAGELLRISFKAKHRIDTVCTMILNPRLAILNVDNLVSSVEFNLKGICVLGSDTVTKTVVAAGTEYLTGLRFYPNPAHNEINFSLPQGSTEKKHLVITDALGKRVLETDIVSDFRWDVADLPEGFYTAILSDISSLKTGRASDEAQKILIVH